MGSPNLGIGTTQRYDPDENPISFWGEVRESNWPPIGS